MKNTKNKSMLSLLICSVLFLGAGCKKKSSEIKVTRNLNSQESKLLGKWAFSRSETYELSGVDSTGTLVNSSTGDSTCTIEFKNLSTTNPYSPDFSGEGSLESCAPHAAFSWNCKQQNRLDINSTNEYTIVYLSVDSAAFSYVYKKDILKLKSVLYYKKS